MPIGFSDLLQTNSQFVNSLTKGVVSTDDTFGGVRSKIDDWTDLHLATRTGGAGAFKTFKDDGTASSPGQFKAYSTIFFVADARALVETSTEGGAIRLDSSGDFISSGGQLYTHDSGTAVPGYYVLTDPTQIDSAEKLPKFTVTGTPGSGSTVLPAGYESFTSANNSSPAITVTDTNDDTDFNLVFATAGTDQSLFVDASTSVLKYNPSTSTLTFGTTVNTASLSTGTFAVTGDVVSNLIPGNGIDATYVAKNLGSLTHPWHELYVKDGLFFEGATANVHETKIVATDPTQDNTITLPDATGIVGFTGADITGAAISATANNTPNVLTLTRADGAFTATIPLANGTSVGTVSGVAQNFSGLKTFAGGVTSTSTLTATNYSVFGSAGNDPARTATFHANAIFNTTTEFKDDVSIAGNLTVSGDVIQANSTAVDFEDAVLALGVPRDSSNAITDGTSAIDTGLNFVKVTSGAAITEFAAMRYDISTNLFKFTRHGDPVDYTETEIILGADNVAALKFTKSDTIVQTNQANGLATMPDDEFANVASVRSLGAVAKCSITITNQTGDSGSNFAPDLQGTNGYVIKHNLNTTSVYVVAIKDPSGTPIPIFCKYSPIDGNIVRVTVGVTADNEVYDIIVIG